MSATVYSTAKFGMASEVTATGIYGASISFAGTSETALAPNHIGQDVGISLFNESIEVTIDGVISVKGAGMVVGMADLVTFANSSVDSLNVFTDLLKVTPVANASVIIRDGNLSRTNNGFETGNLTGIYKPGVDTTAVYTPT